LHELLPHRIYVLPVKCRNHDHGRVAGHADRIIYLVATSGHPPWQSCTQPSFELDCVISQRWRKRINFVEDKYDRLAFVQRQSNKSLIFTRNPNVCIPIIPGHHFSLLDQVRHINHKRNHVGTLDSRDGMLSHCAFHMPFLVMHFHFATKTCGIYYARLHTDRRLLIAILLPLQASGYVNGGFDRLSRQPSQWPGHLRKHKKRARKVLWVPSSHAPAEILGSKLTARIFPTRALSKVLFPTLRRPTIASVGKVGPPPAWPTCAASLFAASSTASRAPVPQCISSPRAFRARTMAVAIACARQIGLRGST
jgi:hypothetical protein